MFFSADFSVLGARALRLRMGWDTGFGDQAEEAGADQNGADQGEGAGLGEDAFGG